MEKQSKTESNNTKWKILIDGDKKYFDDLIEGFKKLKREDIIFKENENFFFNANLFQEPASVKEIIEKTNTFLTIIKSVPPLNPRKDYRVIKIVNVEEISDDGSTVKTYDGEGNLVETLANGKRDVRLRIDNMRHIQSIDKVAMNGEICLCNYDLETIRKQKLNESEINYLKKQIEKFIKLSKMYSGDKEIKEIIDTESKFGTDLELSKWTALRKIYATIRDGVDGIKKLKEKIDPQLLDDFYHTACYYYMHPETKNETENENEKKKKKYKKPDRKIPLSEAEELIRVLLSIYIEEKVKGGEP